MVAAAVAPEPLGEQRPRIRLAPPAEFPTRGGEAIEVAARAGLILDEWQRNVLVDGCRVRPDGRWSAFEVGVNVPRQNGKGGIIEARELAGIFAFGERLITHSAHQFDTSLEAFRRMLDLLEACPDFDSEVQRVARSHGEEGIEFKSGQRLRYRTRTKGGGRGFSGDLMIFDEAMFLALFAHGALLPTLSARPNPQVWYLGSAVDQEVHEHGLVFAKVRARAIEGKDSTLAYSEWSLPYELPGDVPDEVLGDVTAARIANPALGIRIAPEYVAAELEALDARSLAVERFGVGDWPSAEGSADSPIGREQWDTLTERGSRLLDPVCIAFDVSPDRKTAVAAAGRRADGLLHVEVIDERPGTRWLPDRLAEIIERNDVAVVACDGLGPVASVLPVLEEARLRVKTLTTAQYVQACSRLADIVAEQRVRHLGSYELASAIRGARTRPLGDAWAWSRKSSAVNIAPLVAATIALSEADGMPAGTREIRIR